MRQQAVFSLRDSLRNVSGLTLNAGEGGIQGDNLTIRGYSARNDLYLDGVRDWRSYTRDTFNLDVTGVPPTFLVSPNPNARFSGITRTRNTMSETDALTFSRLASFLWIQSMVRDDGERALLFDLDMAIDGLRRSVPDHASVIGLTSCFHNLLRRWADL